VKTDLINYARIKFRKITIPLPYNCIGWRLQATEISRTLVESSLEFRRWDQRCTGVQDGTTTDTGWPAFRSK